MKNVDKFVTIPELSQCELDEEEKDLESSKIMKLIETIKDKVVFKNPLNRVMPQPICIIFQIIFARSGIDLDGGEDQIELVSNPCSTVQMFSNSEPMTIRNSPDTSKSTDEEEAHSASHRERPSQPLYSAGRNNRPGINYSKMPNSCRVRFENKPKPVPALNQEISSARSG